MFTALIFLAALGVVAKSAALTSRTLRELDAVSTPASPGTQPN